MQVYGRDWGRTHLGVALKSGGGAICFPFRMMATALMPQYIHTYRSLLTVDIYLLTQ